MKRFVLWAAVSSQPQVEKVSLENQIELGREHAERHGGQIVAELVVPGESRDIVLWETACQEIAAYAELRTLIEQRAFDVFVFLNRSRLGRTAALSMTVVELCTRAGILPYDMESPPATLDRPRTTHADLLIGAIKSVNAQNEIIELMRRNEIGMAERVRRGEFPGKIPWGWTLRWETAPDGKPLRVVEIDPVAQATWRVVIDLYLHQGQGVVSLADTLREMGRPTPLGEMWRHSTVRWMLDRAWLFAGYVEINRSSPAGRKHVRAKSIWPALITEEEAQAIESERIRRRGERRTPTRPMRFSGVVWCVDCQRAKIGGNSNTYRFGQQYYSSSYECRPRHLDGKISERKIIKAVELAIERIAADAAQQKLSVKTPSQTKTIQRQIAALESQIESLRKARLRADDAYIDGKLDAERYQRQIERLDAQEDGLQEQIEQLLSDLRTEEFAAHHGDRLAEVIEHGRAMLTEPDLRTANAWLRQHLRVWVSPTQIDVTIL